MLTKQEEKLRGKKVIDMTISELKIWINACNKMERLVKANKVRRNWTKSRDDAELALENKTRR